MKQAELTATIERLQELQAQADEINAEIETLKDVLKAEMVKQGRQWYAVYSKRFTDYQQIGFRMLALLEDE